MQKTSYSMEVSAEDSHLSNVHDPPSRRRSGWKLSSVSPSSETGFTRFLQYLLSHFSLRRSRSPDGSINTALCTSCKVLEIDDSCPKWLLHGPKRHDEPWDLELSLDYSRNDRLPGLLTISKTADDGCPFCKHLRSSILTLFTARPYRSDVSIEIKIMRLQYEWNGRWQRLVVNVRTWGLQRDSPSNDATLQPQRTHGSHLPKLRFPGDKGAVSDHQLVFPIRAYQSASSELLKITRSPSFGCLLLKNTRTFLPELSQKLDFWLTTCHTECNEITDPEVPPTRLLSVGSSNDEKIQLLDTTKPTSETRGNPKWRYVALSHSWGDPEAVKPPITTKENLAERSRNISFQELPRTYQDAIIVCRNLSVQYLWIDSLCIVQKDMADWEKESLKMATYYEHAYLTLIPTVAESCSVGFLQRKHCYVPLGTEVKFQSSWKPNISGSYFIGSHDTEDDDLESSLFYHDTAESRWGTRGWTFCEWLFSRRRVYFGEHAIHWSCEKFYSSELSNVMEEAEEHNLRSLIEEHEENVSPGIDTWPLWYGQMLEYSCRDFSNALDRLPAISPLAKVVAERTGDEYLAGLWKRELHVGLLWYASDFETPTCLPGQKEYIAPSWSWLARARNAEISQYAETHTTTPLLKVTKAHTTPEGLNPFGRVRDGYITIEGRVCPFERRSFLEAERDTIYKEILWEGKYLAECSLDQGESDHDDDGSCQESVSERVSEMTGTLLLLVVRDGLCLKGAISRAGKSIDEQAARSAVSGLVLIPSSQDDSKYLRAGIFESLPIERGGRACVEHWETRTITII